MNKSPDDLCLLRAKCAKIIHFCNNFLRVFQSAQKFAIARQKALLKLDGIGFLFLLACPCHLRWILLDYAFPGCHGSSEFIRTLAQAGDEPPESLVIVNAKQMHKEFIILQW